LVDLQILNDPKKNPIKISYFHCDISNQFSDGELRIGSDGISLLQQDKSNDYVVSVSQTNSVKEFLEETFTYSDLNEVENQPQSMSRLPHEM